MSLVTEEGTGTGEQNVTFAAREIVKGRGYGRSREKGEEKVERRLEERKRKATNICPSVSAVSLYSSRLYDLCLLRHKEDALLCSLWFDPLTSLD